MKVDPRRRITSGLNRTRLKLEARRAVRPLLVIGLGVIGMLGGALYLMTNLTTTFGQGTHKVRFALNDATAVKPGIADLRYRGIRAGSIDELERVDGQLVATASIADEYGPLYRDAEAQLRPATPLQDIYLDIVDPGTPEAPRLGNGVLAATQTETPVNINDVLGVLQANERTRLRELLDNLGNGLSDRGADLRAAVVQVTPLLQTAARITDELRAKGTATRRLVDNAAILTEELGRREVELRTLVREGAATFGTLQEGSEDVERTLAELAPTFDSIDSSFTALRGVLGDVDTAVTDLYPVADRLPAALDTIGRLSAVLGPAARELQEPVGKLVPFTRALRPVATQLSATTNALRPQIPAFDKTTHTLAECERGITGFFQWNTSLTKFGDVLGPVPRGTLAIGGPDTGTEPAKRKPGINCAGGETIGGRPALPGDQG